MLAHGWGNSHPRSQLPDPCPCHIGNRSPLMDSRIHHHITTRVFMTLMNVVWEESSPSRNRCQTVAAATAYFDSLRGKPRGKSTRSPEHFFGDSPHVAGCACPSQTHFPAVAPRVPTICDATLVFRPPQRPNVDKAGWHFTESESPELRWVHLDEVKVAGARAAPARLNCRRVDRAAAERGLPSSPGLPCLDARDVLRSPYFFSAPDSVLCAVAAGMDPMINFPFCDRRQLMTP